MLGTSTVLEFANHPLQVLRLVCTASGAFQLLTSSEINEPRRDSRYGGTEFTEMSL